MYIYYIEFNRLVHTNTQIRIEIRKVLLYCVRTIEVNFFLFCMFDGNVNRIVIKQNTYARIHFLFLTKQGYAVKKGREREFYPTFLFNEWSHTGPQTVLKRYSILFGIH